MLLNLSRSRIKADKAAYWKIYRQCICTALAPAHLFLYVRMRIPPSLLVSHSSPVNGWLVVFGFTVQDNIRFRIWYWQTLQVMWYWAPERVWLPPSRTLLQVRHIGKTQPVRFSFTSNQLVLDLDAPITWYGMVWYLYFVLIIQSNPSQEKKYT